MYVTWERPGCQISGEIRGNVNSEIILVTLHGGPGKGCAYLHNAKAFHQLEQHIQIVYFDQRGCGSSPDSLDKELEEKLLVEDVETILHDIKRRYPQKGLVLLGVSFGGSLGFRTVLHSTVHIDGYIAGCPALPYTAETAQNWREQWEKQNGFPLNTPLPVLHTLPVTSQYLAAVHRWFFVCPPHTAFAQIDIPVLVLQGAEDSICPAQEAAAFFKSVDKPDLRYRQYTGCSHNIFLDSKVEFTEDVENFCNAIGRMHSSHLG